MQKIFRKKHFSTISLRILRPFRFFNSLIDPSDQLTQLHWSKIFWILKLCKNCLLNDLAGRFRAFRWLRYLSIGFSGNEIKFKHQMTVSLTNNRVVTPLCICIFFSWKIQSRSRYLFNFFHWHGIIKFSLCSIHRTTIKVFSNLCPKKKTQPTPSFVFNDRRGVFFSRADL